MPHKKYKKREKINIALIQSEIAALVPIYCQDGGNGTGVMTTNGRCLSDKRSLRWFLRRLCRHLAVDLEALREKYGACIDRRNFVPIPLSPQLVLVPLHLRQPRIKGDRASGYVNLIAVKKVEEIKQRESEHGQRQVKSALHLHGEHTVYCYYTTKTVNERLRMARIVLHYYEQSRGNWENYVNSYSLQYPKLAEEGFNREQIVFLTQQLLQTLLQKR
ncbi:MAG: hypothetical protein GX764_03600 [Firmicutes bacterium]|jgi:hypothetical protein|nr:hypothetical protein [Bacillota bacterium]